MFQCYREQMMQHPASPEYLQASCSDGLCATCALCVFQNVLHS